MLLTSNKSCFFRSIVTAALLCGTMFSMASQAQEGSSPTQSWLFESDTKSVPTIYASDAGAGGVAVHPMPDRPLDIVLGNNLQLQMMLPGAAGAGVTQTQGIWRPLDSLSLRAGYQQADGSRLLLCADNGSCAPVANAGAAESSLQSYALGASWQVGGGLNLNVDYITRDDGLASSVSPVANPVWFNAYNSGLGLGSNEAMDISLTCDIDAGNWGDLELGVQISRLADFNYSLGATREESPLNAAAFGLGWQKGTFRGDLTSRYLDVVNVNGGDQTAGWTSFDVSFAWRTPWNASLSVGARNLLNNPAPVSNGLSDAELENFFGRVPYVRYRQDL